MSCIYKYKGKTYIEDDIKKLIASKYSITGDMNDKSKDKEIYEEAAKRAVQAIKQGKQVVFDTTNLTKEKRLPFIEAIKKEIPDANIQYKLLPLNPELAKQRIKAQIARGENRANVSDATIDRHAESYKQMLEDIKSEPISNFEITPQQKQQAISKFQEYVNATGKQDIQGFKDFVQGKQFQKLTTEEKAKTIEQVTKEHRSITALKDLSAKLAYRIGGKIEFVNKTDVDWKAYNQGMKSVLNEAYMTPDTPFHEILAHPIIRAIKNKNVNTKLQIYEGSTFIQVREIDGKNWKSLGTFKTKEDAQTFIKNNSQSQLYQSLLKELEIGRGKEVFEQVKRDYKFEHDYIKYYENKKGLFNRITEYVVLDGVDVKNQKEVGRFKSKEDADKFIEKYAEEKYNTTSKQQEEAIVQIIGLYSAQKLDKLKDKTLIQLIKELLKEMSDFVKLIFKKEINITKDLDNISELTDTELNKLLKNGEITKKC